MPKSPAATELFGVAKYLDGEMPRNAGHFQSKNKIIYKVRACSKTYRATAPLSKSEKLLILTAPSGKRAITSNSPPIASM